VERDSDLARLAGPDVHHQFTVGEGRIARGRLDDPSGKSLPAEGVDIPPEGVLWAEFGCGGRTGGNQGRQDGAAPWWASTTSRCTVFEPTSSTPSRMP
jgi:hypothetical protein